MEGLIWFGIFILVMIVMNWKAIIEFFTQLIIGIAMFAGILFVGFIVITIIGEIGVKNVFMTIFFIGIALGVLWVLYLLFIEVKDRYLGNISKQKKARHVLLNIKVNTSAIHTQYRLERLLSFKDKNALDRKILFLLRSNGADINSKDQNGNTPIHKLVSKNRIDECILFLNKGARLDIPNIQGMFPLDLANAEMEVLLNVSAAIVQKKYDWANTLINCGADINSYDSVKNTPLHYAAQAGAVDIVLLLLEKNANVNAINKNGQTPLHFATERGKADIVKILLKQGASVDNIDTQGRTAVHYSCIKGNDLVLKVLIENNASLDLEDKHEKSPLLYARLSDNDKVVEPIKKHSKKFRKKLWTTWTIIIVLFVSIILGFVKNSNPVKDSLLDFSINNRYFQIADLLDRYGAEYHKKDIVYMIKNNKNVNYIEYSVRNSEIDLNKQDDEGKTLLHYAYEHANPEIIKLLIKYGAKEDAKDKFGRTPRFYAIYNSNDEVEP